MAEISPEYLESLAKFYSNSSFFPFLLLDKTWLYLINWIHANMISKKKLSMESISHLRRGSDWYCPSIVHLLLSFLLYFIYNTTTATATTTTSRCATTCITTNITATTCACTTTLREIGVWSRSGQTYVFKTGSDSLTAKRSSTGASVTGSREWPL